MVMCDLKKMTCDINNIMLDYHEGTDMVTSTSASDVPGFQGQHETIVPGNLNPKIPQDLVKRLSGFSFTLPEPITLTFSGPFVDGAGSADPGTIVTVKLTLSPKPSPRTAPSR